MRRAAPFLRRCRRVAAFAGVALAAAGLAGCGVGQSEECQRYLACQAHYDEVFDRNPGQTNIYQPDGTCWETQDLADACSLACLERMEDLRDTLEAEEEPLEECAE